MSAQPVATPSGSGAHTLTGAVLWSKLAESGTLLELSNRWLSAGSGLLGGSSRSRSLLD